MWETYKTFNGNGSFQDCLTASEQPCKTRQYGNNTRGGRKMWIGELLMLIGFALILGSVNSYSNFRIGDGTFFIGVGIGTVIILIGFAVRKYIKGRWR